MKHRQEDEGLAEFLDITRAEPIMATEEEQELARTLEERRRAAEVWARKSQAMREKKRREEAFLEKAREAVMRGKARVEGGGKVM